MSKETKKFKSEHATLIISSKHFQALNSTRFLAKDRKKKFKMISFQNLMKKNSKMNSSLKRSSHQIKQAGDEIEPEPKKPKLSNHNKQSQSNFIEATEKDLFSSTSPTEDQDVHMFDILHQITVTDNSLEKLNIYRELCNNQEKKLKLTELLSKVRNNADVSFTHLMQYIEEDDTELSEFPN